MRRFSCGFAACVLTVVAGAATGRAEPRAVTWTSYLRAGPGLQYAETDEIQGGGTVDVLGCAGGWCRVLDGRAVGYLEADRVPPPAPAQSANGPGGAPPAACFDARQTGFHGPLVRFCPRLTPTN